MKYIIANGNEYLNLDEAMRSFSVDTPLEAWRFKEKSAINYIKNNLHGDPKWAAKKLFDYDSSRNYVITNATMYVSPEYQTTGSFKKARKFNSLADVETYLSKNKPFEEYYVLDETGAFVYQPNIKGFTADQLEKLGIQESERKFKRILIPRTTRDIVFEKGQGICALCGRPVNKNFFTIDHIVPLNRGGNNEIDNLQIACETCNRLKNDSKEKELISGTTAILSNKMNFENGKEIMYPLIRTFVRSMISGIWDENVSLSVCGGN